MLDRGLVTRLILDLEGLLRSALEPGDFVLYDNQRIMLHARTAFTGPRGVRGIYLHT